MSNNNNIEAEEKRLSDLDTLLGDLERTIESGGAGNLTSGVANNNITTREFFQEVKNHQEIYRVIETNDMASAPVISPAINQNINELDVLLSDLSNARYFN